MFFVFVNVIFVFIGLEDYFSFWFLKYFLIENYFMVFSEEIMLKFIKVELRYCGDFD